LKYVTIGSHRLKLSQCCRRGDTVPSSECPPTGYFSLSSYSGRCAPTGTPSTISRNFSTNSLNGSEGTFTSCEDPVIERSNRSRSPNTAPSSLCGSDTPSNSYQNTAVESLSDSGALSSLDESSGTSIEANNGTLSHMNEQNSTEIEFEYSAKNSEPVPSGFAIKVGSAVFMDKISTPAKSKLSKEGRRRYIFDSDSDVGSADKKDSSGSSSTDRNSIYINLLPVFWPGNSVRNAVNGDKSKLCGTKYSSTSKKDEAALVQVSRECETASGVDKKASDSGKSEHDTSDGSESEHDTSNSIPSV